MAQETGTYDEFFDALGERESSDNYQLVNNGFLGRYQVSEPILVFGIEEAGLPYYAADGDETDNEYNGTWTGFEGVASRGDFLNSEEAQDQLIRAWFDDLLEQYREAGLLYQVGQVYDGVELSATGLLAGAHLVGFPAVQDYLNGPKANVPADGFGTEVTEYFELFRDFEVEPGGIDIDRSAGNGFIGSPGDDSFIGGGGNDTIQGRAGEDTARYRNDADRYEIVRNDDGTILVRQLTGDTPSGGSDDGQDVLRGIEQLEFADRTLTLSRIDFGEDGTFRPGPGDGTSTGEDDDRGGTGEDDDRGGTGDDGDRSRPEFDERWRGSETADRFAGGADRDNLGGLGGNDTVGGRASNDVIGGGGGQDILGGGTGDDTVNGGAGNDRIYAGDGADTGRGQGGDDRLSGRADNDTLNGGNGTDGVFGHGGDDRVNGGESDDRVRGAAGDDTVLGGGGNDGLRGGNGGDALNGGVGNDTLIGGDGEDRFIFDDGFGLDRIQDYEAGEQLDFSRVEGIERFEELVMRDSGDDMVVFAGQDRVRLLDTSTDDVSQEDFIL